MAIPLCAGRPAKSLLAQQAHGRTNLIVCFTTYPGCRNLEKYGIEPSDLGTHECCRSTTHNVPNVVKKVNIVRGNRRGAYESYQSVNALNQGLASMEPRNAPGLCLRGYAWCTRGPSHLHRTYRSSPSQDNSHILDLLTSIREEIMLTKSTVDATARQAHRYNGTRRADSLPFAGSKFRPETADS